MSDTPELLTNQQGSRADHEGSFGPLPNTSLSPHDPHLQSSYNDGIGSDYHGHRLVRANSGLVLNGARSPPKQFRERKDGNHKTHIRQGQGFGQSQGYGTVGMAVLRGNSDKWNNAGKNRRELVSCT